MNGRLEHDLNFPYVPPCPFLEFLERAGILRWKPARFCLDKVCPAQLATAVLVLSLFESTWSHRPSLVGT